MSTANLPDKLRVLRDSLLTGLIERDTPIRLALLSALTGEHLLLIGPPGTAICLDTSGSMHGEPEIVAKAIVLEALRVAHAEKRACYLYDFSGPEDVAEHELTLTEQGLAEFLNFLACSFHGGTDVAEPLRRATSRLQKESWQRADILLISDGEFSVAAETVSLVQRVRKERGLRTHGLLIGNSHSGAMSALSDALHRFGDWRMER